MGGKHMEEIEERITTKEELATEIYLDLKKGCDIQKITKSIKEAEINEKGLSLNEQLEIISLIKQIIVQNTKSCKDVSDFLSLVDQVEEKVKSQNKSTSGGNNEGK